MIKNAYKLDSFSVNSYLKNGKFDSEDLAEIVRLYSAEIEYSEDNVLCIMDAINV